MSIPFLAAAAVMALVVLAWLLRPLLRGAQGASSASRQILNSAIYRDQLAELERDRADGSLAESDFEQASVELQRRLLEDASVADALPVAPHSARRTALTVALLLPLSAALMYAWLGNPAAMQPGDPQHQLGAGQMNELVAKLDARLQKNPNDPQGWAMLGRSYKALGRFDEAEKAFVRAGDLINQDAVLLAEYADLLAVRANGSLEGRPLQLVQQALKIDPENFMALALAGTAAYNRQDFPEATNHWGKLLKLLPPDSEDAKSLSATLADIGAKSGGPVIDRPAERAVAKARAGKPGPGSRTVSGSVTLTPALAAKVQPGDTLFIYARPVDGPRMPLALLRGHVSDLPLNFTLDDSLAISPDMKLSGASEVKLEARVTKSGQAIRQAGDLIGESGPVKTGASGIKLTIDRVSP
ncbi:MAG: c-type cytochrome biogenesis protein CcmI [Rhodocyclaceae bacterium]|nr:MAG: c-type cytochrome biogenesis protein CcmI [Rhodocyclaceae bacterium]